MSDEKQSGDKRRGFPGSFLIFLLVAVLIALTVQNFLSAKYANVSFSYQVQHLVNLELINPADSRMVALGDNLVTISGRFRDRLTEEGKARYKYLELLDREDMLSEKKELLEEELRSARADVISAAGWFLELSGVAIPQGGYVVTPLSPVAPEQGEAIVIENIPRRVTSLSQLQQRISSLANNPDDTAVKQFGSDLSNLVQNFRSPALGIGQENLKQQLRKIDKDVLQASALPQGGVAAVEVFSTALQQLGGIVDELNTPVKGVRLSLLRSVRAYTNTLSDYSETLVGLSQAEAAVDKAREAVINVLWFFDNKELSTRALERQDRELYNQWFQQGKQQWDNFSENKGLPLRAIDQPRTLALERTFTSEPPAPNYMKYLPLILLMGFLVMLLYFVFARQMKGVGGSAMNFGKSPAKMLDKGMSTVTFKDVAGCDEAKEELQEIVDFLKNPSKFTALGGRIPKGVLCIGPPGTGKTLIAKAVAGEANRPFFSISGSDFVEMFVGVGASRIRDLFNQAKKQAPCIVFIDEIDAVGRHRGGGYGGGHDEREQTLNQLLVEMDGFDTNEGVILVAATNRPDVLDKALLRPGRFDRRVTIDLPDIKGRHEILKVHARAIKIDPSVDLMAIARMTPGCSGADLANLLNEAALLAARKGRSAVTPSDTLEAADKVRYGKERRSLEIDPSEKRTTAYHESGHAIVGFVCQHSDPVDKVTVIPRGFSLGATHFLPEKNRLSYWKQEVIDHLAVAMGGRVAEELFVGDISSGAQQDIAQATQLARSMVCEWGMSDSLGLVAYGDRQGGAQYLGLPGMTEKTYSEATAESIDAEVRRITDNAYEQAKKICQEHRSQIELMTEMLIEFETLDREDIKKIMNGTWNTDEKRQKLEKAAAAHTRPATPKKEIAPILPGQPKEQPSA